MESYYEKLKSRVSGIEETYPLQHFKDDVLCYAHCFSMGVTVLMAGQLAAEMPAEKKKFTWGDFLAYCIQKIL